MKKTAAINAPAGSVRSDSAVRRLVVLALLSALGFVSMLIFKVPVISFLKYEPKDIFITFAGFLYGPAAALGCAAVTALLELPFSSTGVIGMIMNLISSAAFACTASLIYKKRRDMFGAAIGLLCGLAVMSISMLLWNYLISPLYMGVTREQIVPMLTSVFLPFNLLKAGINAGVSILLYRPFLRALHLCGFSVDSHFEDSSKKSSIAMIAVIGGAVLAICIAAVIMLNRQ